MNEDISLPAYLPKHIAIIMDGNGRWAKQRFLPRLAGHKAGLEAVRNTIRFCAKQHIEILSLFAFSSENWRRPSTEVNHLMTLFFTSLEKEINLLHENKINLRFIGNRERFPEKLRHKINEVENLTRDNPGLTLIIAADYGGKWDICQATKLIAREVAEGKLQLQDINEDTISEKLSFAPLPALIFLFVRAVSYV